MTFLAGQTWDVFSPLLPTVNADTLQWNAGNLGDRRGQVRLSWEPPAAGGVLTVAGAAGLTGAVDSQDLDGDGVRDGEASGRPNLQSRVAWMKKLSGGRRLGFGASGHFAWQETLTPIAGKDTFRSHSINVDWTLPLHARIQFQGEAWTGRNLADFRGGIAQSVNTAAADPGFGEEIESQGGWAEVTFKIGSRASITPGYSMDDPEDADVPTGGRIKNRVAYTTLKYMPDASFTAGVDLLRWRTDFEGLNEGVDNRINLYLTYNF
jgi:hypothetical protein